MTAKDHKQLAGKRVVGCAVVTCSDTRTEQTDVSGKMIRTLLEEGGHRVVHYGVVRDDPEGIRGLLAELAGRAEVQAVIVNGGTGIAPRDNTFDVVAGMLTKVLPGFGEIFRMLSYQAVGSAAMLSRATAGLMAGPEGRWVIVFSVPGSPNAVELAMKKLILPELGHLAWESTR